MFNSTNNVYVVNSSYVNKEGHLVINHVGSYTTFEEAFRVYIQHETFVEHDFGRDLADAFEYAYYIAKGRMFQHISSFVRLSDEDIRREARKRILANKARRLTKSLLGLR